MPKPYLVLALGAITNEGRSFATEGEARDYYAFEFAAKRLPGMVLVWCKEPEHDTWGYRPI